MDGVEHVVKLTDAGPWGFRLAGGADYRCPLQVSKVRVNSKAYAAGLEEGDIITKVDEKDVRLASHRDVIKLVEQSGDNLSLTILRGVESPTNLYKTFIKANTERRASVQYGEASLIRSREPSISRAQVTLGRAPSPSRALHIITRSKSKERQSKSASSADRLLTVTSPDSNVEYKTFQSEIKPSRLPPARPGKSLIIAPPPVPLSIHRATSLPRVTPGSSITHYIHPVPSTPDPSHDNKASILNKRSFSTEPVIVPIKPFEMPKKQSEMVEFRVRNLNAPRQVWQPDRAASTNGGYSPSQRPYRAQEQQNKEPTKFYWELMENQPDHLPGMVDPLIIDDTQGDFGGNPIIRPERDLYSDSSFYKTKDGRYPTIPEQMRMCRMVSGILDTPEAMRSRGGKMYQQRKQSAEKHAREAMGRKYEPPYTGIDAEYSRPYTQPHWPSTMKENLTVDELERLEHNTENLSKHDLLPPVVAFDINSALTRSRNHGKGVDIYRKNAERAEEFTIDETNRQRVSHPNKLDSQLGQYKHLMQSGYKSPWNAAQEGNLERAFVVTDPYAAQSVKDEQALRKDMTSHALGYDHQQATFGVKYKGFAPVRAPRGPMSLGKQFSSSTSALDLVGREPARLGRMLAERDEERPTYDTYSYKWCQPSYYTKDERQLENTMYDAHGRPTPGLQRRGSMSDLTLRRPREYLRPVQQPRMEPSRTPDRGAMMSTPPNLRRPRDYQEQEKMYEYGSPLSVVTTPREYSVGSIQPGVSVF